MAYTTRVKVTSNTGGIYGLKKGMEFYVPNTSAFPPSLREITEAANSFFGLNMRVSDVSTTCLKMEKL